MYDLTNSLTTSFQARAATRPKPEVARVSIWVMTDWGRLLRLSGGVSFLAMCLVYK